MKKFGLSIRPVMDGEATITQRDVEFLKETADLAFLDWDTANTALRAAMESPGVAYVKIERVDIADTIQ